MILNSEGSSSCLWSTQLIFLNGSIKEKPLWGFLFQVFHFVSFVLLFPCIIDKQLRTTPSQSFRVFRAFKYVSPHAMSSCYSQLYPCSASLQWPSNNSTNQTADVLVEDQPPLYMVTVSQDREQLERNEHWSFVFIEHVHRFDCVIMNLLAYPYQPLYSTIINHGRALEHLWSAGNKLYTSYVMGRKKKIKNEFKCLFASWS